MSTTAELIAVRGDKVKKRPVYWVWTKRFPAGAGCLLGEGGIGKAADETCWITSLALNERHLKRLLADYVGYYHDDRTHLGLRKGTPDHRTRSVAAGRILSYKRLGGLHHRYDGAA
jgi:hypothetical protein